MHLRQGIAAALIAAFALALAASAAGAAKWHYEARKIGTFRGATYITTPPTGRGRLFVVFQKGYVAILKNGKPLPKPFLDQRDITMSTYQRGLLSIVFAPDYAKSGRLYVHYALNDDTVQIDELRRSASDPNRVDPASRRHIINIGKASLFHHGGQLAFGPDGMLYISTGVADDAPSAQDLNDLHGKILRIDPRPSNGLPYTVPPDNPYAFEADHRPEVWAAGLRNPWRFSFDPLTGDMVIGDVGENTYEEVDYLPAGSPPAPNFGFPLWEGFHRLSAGPSPERYVPPVIEHKHVGPYCAVMGGYVVRDRGMGPLYGKYLYGDQCLGNPRAVKLGPGGATHDRQVHQMFIPGPISFGQDNRLHLYAIAVDGQTFRLRAFQNKKSYRPSRIRRITGRSARAVRRAARR